MNIKKYLWELHKLLHSKRIIRIKPTMRCNYNCYYCAVNNAKKYYDIKYDVPPYFKEQPPEFWIKLIKRANPSFISISGGEPGLYIGLHKIVNYAIENNIIVQIMTNLSEIDEYRKFKNTYKITFIFTLHPQGSMNNYNEINKRFSITKRIITKQPSSKTRYEKKMWLKKDDRYMIIYNPDGQLFDSCDSSSVGSNKIVTYAKEI